MFGSDNQAPAHPAVLAAMAAANTGRMGSYGADDWTRRARALVADAFATDDFDLYLVATGGAANGLALSALCPPWGAVVCAPDAHIVVDEGTGPALFTGGAHLLTTGQAGAILTPELIAAVAGSHDPAFVHGHQPRALSLTNLAENGRAIGPARLAALAAAAKAQGWGVHVDGARFGNAVAATGASAAALSWQAGVDVLSLGLTKGGGAIAEALLVFGQARTAALPFLRKRAGQLVSKHRFLAAQVVALLEDGLWLRLAAHANGCAARLSAILARAGIPQLFTGEGDGQGNEVFALLTGAQQAALAAAEVGFYPWPVGGPGTVRLVTSWCTTDDEIAAVARALGAP
jgi:threonine aldolase